MSYEGYVEYYCGNGHRIGSRDCYEDSPIKCPVCGNTEMIRDSVDQTNGCECSEGYVCHAHPKIKESDIIKYDPVECLECNGSGSVKTIFHEVIQCCSIPTCAKCFGTGKEYKTLFTHSGEESCINCSGRGKMFVPVYNLEKLGEKL